MPDIQKTENLERMYDEYYDKIYVYITRRVNNRQHAGYPRRAPSAGRIRQRRQAVSRMRKKLIGCGYTVTVEYGNGYRFERG